MKWQTHLDIISALPIRSKGNVLKILYAVIKDHEGKDFDDIDDLINQVYPKKK